MQSRRATAICRGPAPGVGASASRLEPADTQCTAARRSERFSTLMNGLMWGWLLAMALLHESELARIDPDPRLLHRPMRYDIGLPRPVI